MSSYFSNLGCLIANPIKAYTSEENKDYMLWNQIPSWSIILQTTNGKVRRRDHIFHLYTVTFVTEILNEATKIYVNADRLMTQWVFKGLGLPFFEE